VTFSYFIPTILRLTATEELDEAEVNATLSQWLLLDYGRHALTYSGEKPHLDLTVFDSRL
jgi:hypothetical protein